MNVISVTMSTFSLYPVFTVICQDPLSVSTSIQVHCSVVVVQVLQSLAFLKVLFWSLPDHIVLFFFPYLFTQAVCGMSIGLAITVIGKNRDQVRLRYLKRMC